MTAFDIEREVARFEPEVPIEEAWTPPASWYVRPEFLERERQTTFRHHWQYACPLDKLRAPGDYVRIDLLGESYLVLRDEDGELRGMHNVCRHHAAQLLQGEGHVERLVCPYHGWTYDLCGRLKTAPHMGAMRGFDRDAFGLVPVAVEAWGPFVFVHPGRPERAVADELAELGRRLDAFGMEGLRHVARRAYPMACNWKVFVDNYLDGGYHVPHLHHGLAGQLDVSSYGTEVFDRFSIQSCPSNPEATFRGSDFRERIGAGALYAWIHPNWMVNRYGRILDTNHVVPIDHERCEVVFDYWFSEVEGEEAQRFVELSLTASDDVQQEDVWISESVQRGVASSGYDRGRYAPELEIGMHHFHRLLAQDLRAFQEAESAVEGR